MSERFEHVVSGALAVAAIAIAATLVHREFFEPTISSAYSTDRTAPPAYMKNWEELLPAGRQVADSRAPIQLVEFTDLECPFCKKFDATLQAVQAKYPAKLGVTLIHFPLPMHRFALPAARAAECAVPEKRFLPMYRTIFKHSDSLGLKPWVGMAVEAGVRDTSAFRRCALGTSRVPAIEAGQAAGNKIGLIATPTVIVNGWRFPSPPGPEQLEQTIDALLRGRKPPGSTGE